MLTIGTKASEVDNFTKRNLVTIDATDIVNEITNKYFLLGVERANKKVKACDEKVLYKSIRHYFRNHYFGKLNKELYRSSEVPRVKIPLNEGIYRRFLWYDAFVPGIYGRIFGNPNASVVRLSDNLVGVDKFEHFVGSGHKYFQNYYVKKKSLFSALKVGLRAETGFMGAVTTGVLSYADMVANFNGMRFWNHILQKNDDILGENIGPYVVCEKNRWQVVKEFDWNTYVDAGFDEAINCSEFRNDRLLKKVQYELKKLAKDADSISYCPATSEPLQDLVDKYGDLSPFLINTKGHRRAHKFKYYEKLWKELEGRGVYSPSVEASVEYRPRKEKR